jgi:phospholipase C
VKRLIAALALSGCATSLVPAAAPVMPKRAAARHAAIRRDAASVITNVVVIIQENRTVDNLFNGFPGADTVTSYVAANGKKVTLHPVSIGAPYDPPHNHAQFVYNYHDGAQNRWGPAVNAYVPQSETTRYFQLAQHYAFADHILQPNEGASFAAHQYLIAGQSGGYDADHMAFVDLGTYCGAPAGTLARQVDMTTAFPGVISAGAFPCADYPTIFDLLDRSQISWRYYVNQLPSYWSGPAAVSHIWSGPDRANIVSPQVKVLDDIQDGTLPAVAFVTPSHVDSDHSYPAGQRRPGTADFGPKWVGSITNAIGASKYWPTTAIFVVWDDWGGWYDHYKALPRFPAGLTNDPNEYGFRVPLIVVSPYVIPHRVDHVQRSAVAILRFIETVYGLPSLGTLDALEPDDLGPMFDFAHAPLPYIPVPPSVLPHQSKAPIRMRIFR